MKHRIYSIIGYCIIFLLVSSAMQRFGYYINKDRVEQRSIQDIISVYDYSVEYSANAISSILDRDLHTEIKVLRTAQIFKKENNILVLVGETKEGVIDWFIAQEGRLKFKKTFSIDTFTIYSQLEKGEYIFQENWLVELEYGVKKFIEFEGVFTYM